MKITFAEHPFDTFAAALRQDEVVINALDRLQMQHALNVNLILYSIWYGRSQRGRLLKQDMKALLQNVHTWHERVLVALQRLQNTMASNKKTNTMMIRDSINKEIALVERIERCLIADTLLKLNYLRRNPAQQLSDACHNITNYCLTLRIHLDEDDKKAITALLQAAFPNLIAAEISDICENSLNNSNTSSNNSNFSQLTLDEI
jgi:hypothetical protein